MTNKTVMTSLNLLDQKSASLAASHGTKTMDLVADTHLP